MTIIPVSTDLHITMVESLAREIWTEHYTPIIGEAQVAYMLEKFQSRHAKGFRYFLVAHEASYVGYMGVQPKGDELFLSKVYVAKTKRGKGLGRRCLAFIEKMAGEEGLALIALTVNKNNTDAIAAYERWGFKKLEAMVQDIGSGFVMDDYRMGKPVC
jgi:ribosomal protein S18 acetylase RimI-like enzyme